MSTTKAAGKARQGTPRKGRRLGLKISGGEAVGVGQIIVRQIGGTFLSGKGTKKGRDYTIYSLKEGKVNFKNLLGRKIVEVI